MIAKELDFAREADHLEAIAGNFAGNAEIGFPLVVRELSTPHVLVTSFVDGTKATDFAALEARGVDRAASPWCAPTCRASSSARTSTGWASPPPPSRTC